MESKSAAIVKRHVCELCGAKFQFPSGLVTHIKGKHEKHRPHLCKVEGCGKAFLFAVGLRTHMLRHDGLKPFSCALCTKAFRQKGQMLIHQASAHTPEKEEKRALSLATSCTSCSCLHAELAALLQKHKTKLVN